MDLSGRTLGEFRLRKLIGEGGYGMVYLAEQPSLEREVVIKVLREERESPDARERFLREARLAAQLRHPYAAQVYEFGIAYGGHLLWIAMEMVQGMSLADWLDKNGPMPPERFVPFFECVCQVVHAAHEKGIVHRDLKPSNIMVIESGDRLTAKLLDLGIARGSWKRRSEIAPEADDTDAEVSEPADDDDTDRDTDGGRTDRLPVRPRRKGRKGYCWGSETRRRLTPPDATLGTSQYMAPEMFGGADGAGPEADVYALGVIAYQTLTGRPPFTADNTREYFELHCREPMPPLGNDFPPALDRAIRGALEKHGQIRTHSALELADNLKKALRTSPREQIRTSAQQWFDDRRPQGLLWGADVLEETLRSVPQQTLSQLECSFVAESQRRIRRIRWAKRALAVTAVTTAIGVFLYRAAMHTELAEKQTQLAQEQASSARELAEARVTDSELEQGRSALFHDEPDAAIHLGRAYQRGDHSPSTEFMLARALQPRLAEQARFSSTFGRMWSAAFSPDGRQIVTTDDRAAQVWDARTYRRIFTLFHGDTVYQARYSLDGTRLVTVGGDGTVKIWDAATGELGHELRRDGVRLRYFIAALSPDGKLVAALDAKGNVAHVWDTITGALVADIRNDGMESPSLAFSSDGRWLATTGGDNVHVLDTRTWKAALIVRGPRIHRLAFDPTGAHLLTGSTTGDAAIWSIPSGARVRHLRDVGESVDAVAFSPDGQLVVAASRDGTVQVWRARSGELQSHLNPRHSKIVAVEFDRTSRRVLAAGAAGAVVVLDASQGVPDAVLEGPPNVIVAHFDPSSNRVVGASLDGTAWVWDATSQYHRWGVPRVNDDCGIVTTPEPDHRFIAVGCRDRATRIWDTAHDQLVAELPSVSHVEGDFTSAFPAVSTEGDRAAIARGNTVEVYELPGGRMLRTIAHGAAVNAVAFAPKQRAVVSGSVDGSLFITRDDGTRIALPTSQGGIDAAAFLPDGRLVSSDAHRRLRVYDPGGTVLADIEIPGRVMSLRIDGNHLVTIPILPRLSDGATSPVLVDLERYQIIAQLQGHVGRVFSARWVAGDMILTAGADRTVRLWDGATGRLRQTYQGGSRSLDDATLSPNGLVMAGATDGRLLFWDRDSGRQVWALHAHTSQIIGVHVEGDDIMTRGITGELSRWLLPRPGQVIRTCTDHEHCATVLR
jgi:WD40 repeat protein/serine/threonine protein kinase